MLKVSLLSFLFILSGGCAGLKSKKILDRIDRPVSAFNLRWAKNLDPSYNSGNLPIGTASPFIYEDILYQGNLSGQMVAYDLDRGVEIWKAQEDQPINGKAAIFGDYLVYGTMSGRIYSRHYLTGKLQYATDLGEPIESELSVSQGRMYAHLRNHKIVAMDAATGKILWGYRRSVPYVTTLQRVSTVMPYQDKLIVGFADGHVVALTRDEGVVAWEQKIAEGVKFVDVDVEPIYFNGQIVVGSASGRMRFINPENGLILKMVELTIAHAPIKSGDDLIVGTIFGEVARIDKDGKILINRKITNAGISSIVAWKKGLAVATMSGKIYYLNSKNLTINDEFELGSDQSAVFGHLQTNNKYLAVYSSRNRLYVFRK
jgi:outer membrane protein assembly factor BamB